MSWTIGEVDRVEITTVCDNYMDTLYMDPVGKDVKRKGLGFAFNPANMGKMPVADNCSAMIVDLFAFKGNTIGVDERYRILFDCGGDGDILVDNMKCMGIDPLSVNQVVISHGHPDHFGGIKQFMEARGGVPCPVLIHPDTFSARYIFSPHGFVFPHITAMLPSKQECIDAGARFVEVDGPVKVGPGCATTGVIPWYDEAYFEPSPITLYHNRGGGTKYDLDKTPDEMALAINLKGNGLVIVSGCSHNGIVNTCRRAQEVTGVEKIYAIVGGYHLGFPEVPEEMIQQTIDKLKELDPEVVIPMHCTGFKATAEIWRQMPDQFVLDSLGNTFCFPFPSKEETAARLQAMKAIHEQRAAEIAEQEAVKARMHELPRSRWAGADE